MKYGRIENGELRIYRFPFRVDGRTLVTNDPARLLENGLKQVIYTPIPEPVEGYYYASSWKETDDRIVREWTELPLPDEPEEGEE